MGELFKQLGEPGKTEGNPTPSAPAKQEASKETSKENQKREENKTSQSATTLPSQPQGPTVEDDKGVPAILTPAAPDATQTSAPVNKGAVEGGQASTNPAQKVDHDQHSEEALDDEIEAENRPVVNPEAEMAMLKQRARLMGVSHSNNIGLQALRDKIAAKLAGEEPEEEAEPSNHAEGSNVSGEDPNSAALYPNGRKSKAQNVRQYLQQEEMKLIRLRITNLDPKKKDLQGEIFTVANKYIGTVRKFIPFGEVTDNGYHVPYCLYRQIRDREFLDIRTKTKNGQQLVEHRYVREFALEVLPPLTQEELAKLSTAQLAKGGVE